MLKFQKYLNINIRYVGEEPTSLVTGIYNQLMIKKLPENGIKCIVVPRKMNIDGNNIISASGVREAIKKDKMDEIKNMVPECTYKFFNSEERKNIVKKHKKWTWIASNIIKIYLFSLFNYIFIFINII